MKQSLAEQIVSTRAQLHAAKPNSQTKIRLFYKLRDLIVKELRREIREDRKAA